MKIIKIYMTFFTYQLTLKIIVTWVMLLLIFQMQFTLLAFLLNLIINDGVIIIQTKFVKLHMDVYKVREHLRIILQLCNNHRVM